MTTAVVVDVVVAIDEKVVVADGDGRIRLCRLGEAVRERGARPVLTVHEPLE